MFTAKFSKKKNSYKIEVTFFYTLNNQLYRKFDVFIILSNVPTTFFV